jgi:hypothetical protein
MSHAAKLDAAARRVSLGWIALLTGVVPVVVIHACYLTSSLSGHIPLCVPYLSGCTSISATGRYGISYFVFKAGMLPGAVLLAFYWLLNREWLLTLGDRDGATTRWMVRLGLTAAAFLVLYVVFLGSKGEFYALMRRYGVTVYFSFNYLAQLLLVARLRELAGQGTAALPGWLVSAKLWLLLSLLAMGLVSIPVQHWVPEGFRSENVLEWNFALLTAVYYLLTWLAWRRTGFGARFGTNTRY